MDMDMDRDIPEDRGTRLYSAMQRVRLYADAMGEYVWTI